MQNEDEFTKEFGELKKRRFWLLVRRPQTNDNGHFVEADPVIKIGSRVKWKNRWWRVVRHNSLVGWTVKGKTPGRFTSEQTKVIKQRSEIEDVREVGCDGGFVLLRRRDWKRLKRV